MDHVPAEIILKIFCTLDTRFSIVSLAATSHKFGQIWHNNAATISEKVFDKEIPGHRYALMLLKVQYRNCPDPRYSLYSRNYWHVLERNRILLFTAKGVHRHLCQLVNIAAAGIRHRPKVKFFLGGEKSSRYTSSGTCSTP